jgi:hypothetical protein
VADASGSLWAYRDPQWHGIDLSGFDVAARDGSAGRVGETDAEYLVVHTGPWILRRPAILPAGLVDHIDAAEQVVYVGATKQEIRSAPEPGAAAAPDARMRSLLADHYGPVRRSA